MSTNFLLFWLFIGPEMLLRQTSNLAGNGTSDGYFEGEFGDAIEAHEWKCVRTINGILHIPFFG